MPCNFKMKCGLFLLCLEYNELKHELREFLQQSADQRQVKRRAASVLVTEGNK